MVWLYLFWITMCVVIYAYIAYPLLLKLLNTFQKKVHAASEYHWPDVTIVIASYNEEKWMEAKLANTCKLQYPGSVHILVVDSSDDHTADLVKKFPRVHLLQQSDRMGKAAALNEAMQHVSTPITVFTDANTLLQQDALLRMIPHFADAGVGGVSGRKCVQPAEYNASAADAEATYWQYESWVKQQESDFYTLPGAVGELFAIRTALFSPIPMKVIADDLFIAMTLQEKGARIKYEPAAVATECTSASLADEWRRKLRIGAGGFQSLWLYRHWLYPGRDFRFTFQFFSHRVLRWLFCPPALIVLFIANFRLSAQFGGIYTWYATGQLMLYLTAIIRTFFANRRFPALIDLPFYFFMMHAAMLAGFVAWQKGEQTVLWKKANR